MNYKPVQILALGMSVPDTIVTNDDLTKILDTSDEWISTRTGIKQRHIASWSITRESNKGAVTTL